MKTLLLTILAILTISSCGVINKGMHNHYILYKTKAFFVIEKMKPHKLLIENAQGTQKFRLYDYDQMFNESDTIIVKENQWVFGQLRFVKNN